MSIVFASVRRRADRRDEQGIQLVPAERAHRWLAGRYRNLAVQLAGWREAQQQARVVRADPVAAVGIDRGTVRPARVVVQIGEYAPVVRRAGFDVVVEGPDLPA